MLPRKATPAAQGRPRRVLPEPAPSVRNLPPGKASAWYKRPPGKRKEKKIRQHSLPRDIQPLTPGRKWPIEMIGRAGCSEGGIKRLATERPARRRIQTLWKSARSGKILPKKTFAASPPHEKREHFPYPTPPAGKMHQEEAARRPSPISCGQAASGAHSTGAKKGQVE